MGYESDTVALLPAGTVCSAGLTTGTVTVAGSDFVRAKLHVSLTAQAGTWTTTGVVAVLLQSSPDGGSTWYPDAAATIAAAGYASSTTISGYQALFTAGTTPVTGKYSLVTGGFPGNLFRAAVYVVTGTSVTLGISGDFQKWLPDNS
jgi:putative alpha-1,2-mannosidase